MVLCGKRSAYVERDDDAFLTQARRFYAELEAAGVEPVVAVFGGTHQVVVSGHHWIDIMAMGANKGVAVRQLQAELGIGPHQTAAFGDYHNDLELLDAAEMSFAVANAHPEVIERAQFVAPSNAEAGVLTVLAWMLELLESTDDGLR
ncbi:hypothetical protein BH09ACT11_BH09ACT11_10560 [soil metagenome]